MPYDAILFDLDGTLADTAPDLAAALNTLRIEEGLPALPLETLRPMTSHGARGLLSIGFAITPDHPDYAALATRFLGHYEKALCVHTHLFDGIDALLQAVESLAIPWGVVTNKAARFTNPLLSQLGLTARAACIISGDTAARPKPHPDPLLLAAEKTGVPTHRSLYVGDDLRDIEAGHAAGMKTVAVRYGYLGETSRIEDWGADIIIDHPEQLLAHLG